MYQDICMFAYSTIKDLDNRAKLFNDNIIFFKNNMEIYYAFESYHHWNRLCFSGCSYQ